MQVSSGVAQQPGVLAQPRRCAEKQRGVPLAIAKVHRRALRQEFAQNLNVWSCCREMLSFEYTLASYSNEFELQSGQAMRQSMADSRRRVIDASAA